MIKSGLVALVASVQAYFDARSVGTQVGLGWKQPTQQINQGVGRANRVVFIPSDPSGKGGKLAGAQRPGQRNVDTNLSMRSLYNWERFVTVSVWACDTTDPQNEEKQIEAVETLFEHTVRAVHYFAANEAQWGDVTWTTSPVEHAFGRELRAGLVFRHPIFDAPNERVYPAPAPPTKVLSHTAG